MKYQLTSQQIASKVAGEIVILNHSKGSYYGLKEVGATIWESLETGPQTLDALCETVMGEYEIDSESCKKDVDALLQDLISERLVQVID